MAPNEIIPTATILPYVVPFISSLLIFLIGYFVSEWNKSKESRKKRTVWIRVLESNKNVKECLQDFGDIQNPTGDASLLVGNLGTILLIIFLLGVFYSILHDQWLAIAASSLIDIAPFLVSLLLLRYIESEDEKGNLLNKAIPIVKWLRFARWFIFSSGFFTIGFVISIYWNLTQVLLLPSDLPYIEFLFYISILLLSVALLLDNTSRRNFFNDIKDDLNAKYMNGFPHIDIKTKTGEETKGKIQNIFHEDLIILDNNGTKEIAVWDEISTLKSTMK